MSNDNERYYAEMESARNISMEAYFAARPQLFKTIEQQCLFKAGFERAFAMLWTRALAVEEATSSQRESKP